MTKKKPQNPNKPQTHTKDKEANKENERKKNEIKQFPKLQCHHDFYMGLKLVKCFLN